MRIGIGMRWWLAAVFALIAAVTALAAGQLVSRSSEHEFRQRAQQLAAGNAFEAAISIRHSAATSDLRRREDAAQFTSRVEAIARERRIALFVFDRQGALLTSSRSRGVELDSIGVRDEALRTALAGRRFVRTNNAIGATVIAIPLSSRDSAALLAYASHPDLRAGLGIVRHEVVRAVLWAILIGALVGLVVAALIASRLRRIATAAAAIEEGRFELALRPRFKDELGELALTIDRMRRRLQQSFGRLTWERDRLRSLLGRLQEGVITVDRSLQVEFANDEARRLLGARLRPGGQLPEPWRQLSLRQLAKSLFATQEVVESSISPDDDSTYIVVGLPAPRSGGDTVVIVVTDVSERERRERAQREFVTNAAHELRTPLTTITGAVEALQSGAKEEVASRDRFLAHIERESARLGRLVRALLVLARAQTGEERPSHASIKVRPLLEEVARDIHPREGVAVEIACAPDLTAAADADLLAQALSNLAVNAASHTEKGRIRLSGTAEDTSVRIEVTDTGPGIRPEDQRGLFDRFYRGAGRNADGFGLGLAIVREVVRALGGTVTIESELGRGTTVRIRLSSAAARAA